MPAPYVLTAPDKRGSTDRSAEFERPDVPFNLSPIAETILAKRYLKKDADGRPLESPEDMFWRVATTIAAEDARYGASREEIRAAAVTFYTAMVQGIWEPNSPTLMNAGRPLGQLSACFVLPVADSLANGKDGIYDTLRAMALVHQSGGGTGFSFSRLRPVGAHVRSTSGVASGPVSFMKLYDASTEVVKQGGTRRGANMGILRVDHPDIESFVACKQDTSQITNFNISVAITDRFMAAVEAGESYNLIDPRTGDVTGSLDARTVWQSIIEGGWATGEPGVFFIDAAERGNPVPARGRYEASNPCGEQPLLPYDVCNLGSLNLSKFVKQGPVRGDWRARVDWDGMARSTKSLVHFLDNVIDANAFPLPEIEELSHSIRRVGAGVMGFADMLVALGVGYNTDEGVEVGREVARFFNEQCRIASSELAARRGTFPDWPTSVWGSDETCARTADGKRIRPMTPLRNSNITTVAPTGTISMIAGCSGGIEPLFAVAFMRNQAGERMRDVNPDFVARAQAEGWYSEALMERIAEAGNIHFPEVPEVVKIAFVTAHDIAPEWHVRMQAAWQESIDSAISKTTNFPREATKEQVQAIYEMAFKLGCKGVTVYRDGSRDGQVLSTGKTETKPEQIVEAEAEVKELRARVAELEARTLALQAEASVAARRAKRSRPEVLHGFTRRIESPLGEMFVTLNVDDQGSPFEAFIALGKAGGAAMADTEAMGRLISLALRSGVPISAIHKQLRGISTDRAVGFGPNKVLSVPDAIAQVIEKYQADLAGRQQELPLGETLSLDLEVPASNDHMLDTCPECRASTLVHESGCSKCVTCGFSECS